MRRRLGQPGSARAEVLAGVVPRGGTRGAHRCAVRAPGLGGSRPGPGDLPFAHARRVGGVCRGARLLPGARARARRGDGLRARARAGDGRRDRPAGRRGHGSPARRSGQADPHSRRPRAPAGPGARRAHRGGAARGRLLRGRGGRVAGERRGGGAGRVSPGRHAAGVSRPAVAGAGVSAGEGTRARTRGGARARTRVRASAAEAKAAVTAVAAEPEDAQRPLLKMSELAERSGVSPGTIRYYLREGLPGAGEDVLRASRNMAYYPPEYVERIALIKRLQEERFMPLRVIKGALEDDPERVRALIELEDRILERALTTAEDRGRVSRKSVQERYGVPRNVLERLAEIGVLTPNQRGYDKDDVKIIEAIANFRAGGYEEALGFTVYDTLRYRKALEPLVQEEVRALLGRLAGEVEVERAMEIVAAGVEPLRELIGAMHSKLLLAALRDHRGGAER